MLLSASSSGSTTALFTSSGLAPGKQHRHVDRGGVGLREQVDAEFPERKDAEHHERHHQHRGEARDAGRRVQTTTCAGSERRRRGITGNYSARDGFHADAVGQPVDVLSGDGLTRVDAFGHFDAFADTIADLDLARDAARRP